MNKSLSWSVSRSEVFWRDIAPGEHVLQVYDNEEAFIDTLAAFAGSGINAGESVVIIAFPHHRDLLEKKLRQHVLQIGTLQQDKRLILLDAADTLGQILKDGMPDQERFNNIISSVIQDARGKEGRKVRAFSEMVAVLTGEGNFEGTCLLESFWSEYCAKQHISLLCAYPREVVEKAGVEHLNDICNCHTKIIKVSKKPLMEVMYQDVEKSA